MKNHIHNFNINDYIQIYFQIQLFLYLHLQFLMKKSLL